MKDIRRRVLKQGEVATLLGVSTVTVGRWMDRGELPYVKVGPQRFVRPEDLGGLADDLAPLQPTAGAA